MKQLNETIAQPDFDVYSYAMIDKTDAHKWHHWTKGLKMVIIKNGITIELCGEEIQQLVNTLPRTFGQSYK